MIGQDNAGNTPKINAWKSENVGEKNGNGSMSNLTGKFLSQEQMAEAKRSEAVMNAIQKRDGTNFPLSPIIAWGCGCCIGPVIMRRKPILSASEADRALKKRKVRKQRKHEKDDFESLQAFRNAGVAKRQTHD